MRTAKVAYRYCEHWLSRCHGQPLHGWRYVPCHYWHCRVGREPAEAVGPTREDTKA